MKKGISIGTSNFKKLRSLDGYYVDKSLMIKEIIETISEVVLLPRPRRFGKTLNMSMLRYFFDLNNSNENRQLFKGLLIENEAIFDLHQGKYPVVFISFKDINEKKFNSAYESILNVIVELFIYFQSIIDVNQLSYKDQVEFNEICNLTPSVAVVKRSLKLITKILFEIYGVKPILLIDEYDTPIHSAYIHHYYEEMIGFMRTLLGTSLKDNEYLGKAVLTGTLRIAKESIFTGFNNPSVYTILNPEFNQFFGFTPKELNEMLVYYEIEHLENEIKNWYNGYIFGDQEIYNPWSILKFVASQDKKFIPHWVNTSSNDLIKELIVDSPPSVREDLLDLLKGKPLIQKLNENISFPELNANSEAIFSFLVFSGYLKANLLKFEGTDYWYELTIPNIEVQKVYEDIILKWFKESFQQSKSQDIINALLGKDISLFEELLNDCVPQTLSFYDVEKRQVERVYQAFILGLLVTLEPVYEVTSNRESGYGRYDICVLSTKHKKTAIIMELKSLRAKETAKKALASALEQIETKQYESAVRQQGYEDVLKLAVVFDGKKVWVKESSK